MDHLGHILHESGSMLTDMNEKRFKFVRESSNIRDTFDFAHPMEVIEATKKYCCSWYGSNLWDLGSVEAQKVYSSWTTCLKLAWNTPRQTRSYLVQEILAPDIVPLKVELLLRQRKFFRNLLNSPSPEVVTAALLASRDIRTTLGKNLDLISRESGLDSWTSSRAELRKELLAKTKVSVPEGEMWRLPLLRKLLIRKLELQYSCNMEEEVENLNSQIYSLSMN